MAKAHESKLFITETEYRKSVKFHVHRTRERARAFKKKQETKKAVLYCRILPAVWGPAK